MSRHHDNMLIVLKVTAIYDDLYYSVTIVTPCIKFIPGVSEIKAGIPVACPLLLFRSTALLACVFKKKQERL